MLALSANKPIDLHLGGKYIGTGKVALLNATLS